MITKAELKYYSSLLQKKYRDETKKFLVEGEKFIFEAVNSQLKCEAILYNNHYYSKNNEQVQALAKLVDRFEIIPEKDFQKIQSTITSQGIAGVFTQIPSEASSNKITDNLIVALEGINDPGNVGTIIRNADWFGIKNILLDADCADIYNPKTIRASAGSIFHINLYKDINMNQMLNSFKQKKYKILCTDTRGNNIYNSANYKKAIIVFSNEANGPSENLMSIADEKLTIPKIGKAESLNVASASAVILSELTKRS